MYGKLTIEQRFPVRSLVIRRFTSNAQYIKSGTIGIVCDFFNNPEQLIRVWWVDTPGHFVVYAANYMIYDSIDVLNT